MIKNTSHRSIPIIVSLALALTSCASTGKIPVADETTAIEQDIVYEVKPGDQLGSISERFTGQFDQWRAIAAHNGITDPRTLAAGQTLIIPGSLLNSLDNPPARPAADSPLGDTTTIASRSPSPITVTTGNGVSIVGARNTTTDTTSVITVSPVEVNRSFVLEPLDEPQASDSTDHADDSVVPRIKVSGTYYPKGIYQEPANYARLMRRVAPGTVFPLESKVNAWYKIVTDDGVGYIRQSDSVLME